MAQGNERIHIGLVKVSTGEVIRCSRVKFQPDFDFLKLYLIGIMAVDINDDDLEIIEFADNDEVLHYKDSMNKWAEDSWDEDTQTHVPLEREKDLKYLNNQRKVWMKRNKANKRLEWNENDEVLYPFLVEPQEIKDQILSALPPQAQAQIKHEPFDIDAEQRPIFRGKRLLD